jgi:FMN reductase
MATRALAVVSAGLSNPSSTRLLADRLTAADGLIAVTPIFSASAVDALRERADDPTLEVIELREHARDLADNLVTGFPNQPLRRAVEAVTGADGLIAVTPIFSASYSGLFKTFFDVLDKESLVGKPVLLGATAGTARHSLALEHAVRPLFAYLRAVTVPTAVFAAPEDWAGGVDRALAGRIDRAAGELADLVSGRPASSRPVDPFDDPTTSFEELLRGN